MDKAKPFTCIVIGEGSLPRYCLDRLQQQQHQVLALISPDAVLRSWADECGLPAFPQVNAWQQTGPAEQIDYLFSIVNSQILPDELLALPRQMAINYHDGPLPRYAGQQATSWAILNGEQSHAITWHQMTAQVDAGPILQQIPVPIRPEDTALTLNARCYEAAQQGFDQLLADLGTGRTRPQLQDLNQRSYYGRFHRPPANALLDWTQTAASLHNLVRSLNFGAYLNPLALPKMWVGEQDPVCTVQHSGSSGLLGVGETAVMPSPADPRPPGTILAQTAEHLIVAAGEGALQIGALLALNGRSLPIEEAAAHYDLRPGRRLSLPDEETAAAITRLGQQLARHDRYWQKVLAQRQPLDLPWPPPATALEDGWQRLALTLPDGLEPAWLPAAWAAYLTRLSRPDRDTQPAPIDIGYSGPAQAELARFPHLFAAVVPLRLHLAADSSAAAVRQHVADARAQAGRRLGYAQDIWGRTPDLRGQTALWPLLLVEGAAAAEFIPPPGCGLALLYAADDPTYHLIYDGRQLDANSVARIPDQLHTLLAAMGQPDTTLAEWPLLPAAEQKLLAAWNDTAVNYQESRFVHQIFAAQAEATPDAIALIYDGGRRTEDGEGFSLLPPPSSVLTYSELNQRANQLAHYLQAQGIGPGSHVALFLERSPEMVVAIYATLKSGAAYVPLDPDYPTERLAFMLEDVLPALILSQTYLAAQINPLTAIPHFCLDGDWDQIAGYPIHDPVVSLNDDDLAYIIYTSGSTGRPKGVMNRHGAIRNRLLWMQAEYRLGSDDVVVQKTPYSFDVSVWEFLWPLMVGARLVIARPGGHKEVNYLTQLIRREKVTTIHFVPSMLQLFLQARDVAACTSLRRVICSGEALNRDLQERFFAVSQAELHNLYGPTEAAIDVTYWACRRDSRQTIVPIGRPIANSQIHILDAYGRPQPIGVAGELHISGANLARGYLNRPQLTAEKFITHNGQRLYRTGDLARWREDGTIEYLSRLDFQVKVHGFRIELGEIEAILARHEAVGETAVSVHSTQAGAVPTNNGQNRLIAYLVPRQPVSDDSLRQHLLARLPDYMVPAQFIRLTQFPLTTSGKIDRRALPPPSEERPSLSSPYTPPTTPLQTRLVELWQELLDVSPIGIHDNFFELGGDSISGAVFLNQLQEELDTYLYIVTLFEAPTIARFLERIEEGKGQKPEGRRQKNSSFSSLSSAFASLWPTLSPGPVPERPNPPALFILAPPRSGSTLLRVMLAGHPHLFAPPELDMLNFHSLAERRDAFAGPLSLRLEGAIRALMESHQLDVSAAKALMAQWEAASRSTADFYRELQTAVSPRLLVDKSPAYSLDTAVLQRAEQLFEQPRYIHLLRHPYAMIHSFVQVRLDQTFLPRPYFDDHPFSLTQLAEFIWLISQQNILRFLETIPPERQFRLHFEELVRQPQPIMEQLAHFLAINPDLRLWQPYREMGSRMTDGLYEQSRMVGDVKFHEYTAIDPDVADEWQQHMQAEFLSVASWQVAHQLGYTKDNRRYPLSFPQQRLWFLDQFEPGSAAYNIPRAVTLHGRLDAAPLQQALTALAQRHEVLRTGFAADPDRPDQGQQIVYPQAELPLIPLDFSHLPPAEQDRRLRQTIETEVKRPFALNQPPLLHLTLIRQTETRHLLLLVMHHIISDGWSMSILTNELAQAYEALRRGQQPDWEALPRQYGHFARWQREQLQGERLVGQLDYWQNQLAGISGPLPLPTDRPRPPRQTFNGRSISFSLPASLVAGLRQLSRDQDVTLFMTLLATFQLLLARSSGREDISVGTPVAGRNQQVWERVLGMFVNTLVLRTDLSGQPTFAQLLRRVRQVVVGALAHQEIPFEQLVELLQPRRSLSHHPLFQVMLVLQNAPPSPLRLPGLTLEPYPIESVTAKFELTLSLQETADSLHATLEYNSDLFDRATIERLAGHWQQLLQAAVANPQQAIGQMPLLTPAEQAQLQAWNETTRDWPPATIPQLIAAQIERTPAQAAICFQERTLTYAELAAHTTYLARQLAAQGIGPGCRVGLLLERSLEMVVGLLAVLQTGAAYVPLDPDFPEERLAFMIEDAALDLLLTNKDGGLKSKDGGIPSFVLRPPSATTEKPEFWVNVHDPAALAYIIYTSGSTGRPKGVMVTHGSVVNFLQSMAKRPGLTAADRLLAVTTLSFDIAVLELLLPLTVGAQVIIADRETVADGRLLAQALARNKISVMQATPATWQALQISGWSGQGRLKILCGGDTLSPELARYLLAQERELWNLYGPTETTIWSTVERVERVETAVSIGRPIANTCLRLLDRQGQPVPVGVAGELYIGGAGVAAGYRQQPELTAEKFVNLDNDRFYRTGDLAKWLPDGRLLFLGRVDFQVKVRGFRIELGEIEAHLTRHEAVNMAVVVARPGPQGETRLVAYWTAEPDSSPLPGSSTLRHFLQQTLPDYMLPGLFVRLNAWPLTPNGKIDRTALPVPGTGPVVAEDYVAPRTPLEEKLAAIWADLLGRERVGIHDNFFDLGGHSLLALRLLTRLEQEMGRRLPLLSLFQQPTVAELVSVFSEQDSVTSEKLIVDSGKLAASESQNASLPTSHLLLLTSGTAAQKQAGSRPGWFGLHPVTGSGLVYRELAALLGEKRPFNALQAPGLDGRETPLPTVEQLAAHHLAAVRQVQPAGPYHLLGWSLGGLIAYEMAQQLRQAAETVARLVLLDTAVPQPPPPQSHEAAWRLARFAVDWQLTAEKPKAVYRQLAAKSEVEQQSWLLAQARAGGLVAAAADWETVRPLLTLYQNNLQAYWSYRPRPYAGPTLLLRAAASTRPDEQLGWASLLSNLAVAILPGRHETVLLEENNGRVARYLQQYS